MVYINPLGILLQQYIHTVHTHHIHTKVSVAMDTTYLPLHDI